jgi:CRP-like cAMP-binding protein
VAGFVSNVLIDDPDLGAGLSGLQLRRAERDLIAAVVVVEGRTWTPDEEAVAAQGGIGLLVLEGLLVRRVGLDGRSGAELLGPGDVLRPWQHDGEDSALHFDATFRVVERSFMAQLDRRFTARLAQYPEVVAALVGRALQRSRTLSVNMAIAHSTRVDQRLLLLFWHLADRWGHVTSDGVRVSLTLTHGVLADLVLSRRPSVTAALTHLANEGVLRHTDGGWMLTGEPPQDLRSLALTA